MTEQKTIYLLQGGHAKDNPDYDFFLITYGQKQNYGYIGKKGRNRWKLYTVLYSNPEIKKPESPHFYFKSFEECLIQLNKLTKLEIKVCYIEDSSVSKIDNTVDKSSEEYITSDYEIINDAHSNNLKFTPGAAYKLELYLEFIKSQGEQPYSLEKLNSITYNLITENQKARLERLAAELEIEKGIIRPEDVPDLDN